MKLFELFNSDIDEDTHQDNLNHNKSLQQTGFWGKVGAGGLILSKNTGKFLLAHRSSYVEQPDTWGIWGGAINKKTTPKQAVKEEIMEETGYTGKLSLIPLYIFIDPKGSGFKYYNFLAIVEDEFTPQLNWETSEYKWCTFGEWPNPLHFGLKALLNDSESIQKIQLVLEKISKNLAKQRKSATNLVSKMTKNSENVPTENKPDLYNWD